MKLLRLFGMYELMWYLYVPAQRRLQDPAFGAENDSVNCVLFPSDSVPGWFLLSVA